MASLNRDMSLLLSGPEQESRNSVLMQKLQAYLP